MTSNMNVNAGKGIELVVDVEGLPTNALEHVIRIGLRNILMDSHAGINQKAMPELSESQVVEQSKAVAEKKLAALMAGEVRVAGTRAARVVDPVGAEMAALAKDAVAAAIKAKGLKVADYKDRMPKLIADYTTKHGERLRPIAEARVAQRAELAGDIEL